MDNTLSNVVKNVVKQMQAVPSLYELALVKTAGAIFDQGDIKVSLLAKYEKFLDIYDPLEFRRLEWKSIGSKVAKKVSKMCLPEKLQQDILDLAWPMSLEILYFIACHSQNTDFEIGMPKQICWKWQGDMDKRRTVQLMIRSEKLCILQRYRLACLYCLEEDIRALWELMNRSERNIVSKKSKRIKSEEHELVRFWSNHMEEMPNQSFSCEEIFGKAVFSNNVAAAKYFLQKFSLARKQEVLLRNIGRIGEGVMNSFHFPVKDNDELLIIFISHLEIEHAVDIFTNSPFPVLCKFLHSGREIFFMEILEQIASLLDRNRFASLLLEIFHKYQEGYKMMYYRKLFIDVWKQYPGNYKSFVSTEREIGAIFVIGIIKDTFPFISKARAYKNKANRFCKLLKVRNSKPPFRIHEDKWKFLKILLQERISTKQSLVQYIERYPQVHQSIHKKKEWDQRLDLVKRILSDEIQA